MRRQKVLVPCFPSRASSDSKNGHSPRSNVICLSMKKGKSSNDPLDAKFVNQLQYCIFVQESIKSS